jgi:hypothetical protein
MACRAESGALTDREACSMINKLHLLAATVVCGLTAPVFADPS